MRLSDYEMEWIETSKKWKAANPCDFDGYWYCVIGGGALTDGQGDAMGGLRLNLGHDISRARDSKQIHNLRNIRPICPKHNREQGSLSFEEYRAKSPSKRCGI